MRKILFIFILFLTNLLLFNRVLVAQIDLADGLVAYYPFNGNADDVSGNGNNGNVYGVLSVADKNKNQDAAFYFDGIDDYIETEFNFNGIANDFSINYWININTKSGEIFQLEQDNKEISNYFVDAEEYGDNYLSFYMTGSSDGYGIDLIDTILKTKQWFQITLCYNHEKQTKLVYINSQLYFEHISNTEIDSFPNSVLRIGSDFDETEFFNGSIDEFRIYNRILSQNEIKALYNYKSGYPPLLTISDIIFTDENNNNRIDGNETCNISFKISNTGKGDANNVKIKITDSSSVTGLEYNSTKTISHIISYDSQEITIPFYGNFDLTTGTSTLNFTFEENMGFPPDDFTVNVATKELPKPVFEIVDYAFLSDKGKIKLGYPVQLKIIVQNVGQAVAEDVNLSFSYPEKNVFPNGETYFEVGNLAPNSSQVIVFEFVPNKLYTDKIIPLELKVNEKYSRYNVIKKYEAAINAASQGTTVNIESIAIDNPINITKVSLSSDVDINIPVSDSINSNRFALIIGNENYKENGGLQADVTFAINDAQTFKQYAIKTLGIPEINIKYIEDATSSKMKTQIDLFLALMELAPEKRDFFIFYAGHGYPDKNKDAYLMPVDVSADYIGDAIKLSDLYQKITEKSPKSVTIFIDACFSGGGRTGDDLVSARSGVKIKPNENVLKGNIVVFAASSEEQVAKPYDDKQHGMFSYFLFKTLKESNGNITYGKLADELVEKVSTFSITINNTIQSPKVNVSNNIVETWENWNIK